MAAFNAGFRMQDANGGYYTQGKTVIPLRSGAASFVIYRNGAATVGAWGSDVTMTPQVVAVRQNLKLLVDNGQPVPGLNAYDTSTWGNTLGNQVYVSRSGIGVTRDGALVYVGGPFLNITDLANLLVRAGAVRAMELDINTDWVNFATFAPTTPSGLASPANGTDLLPLADMAGPRTRLRQPGGHATSSRCRPAEAPALESATPQSVYAPLAAASRGSCARVLGEKAHQCEDRSEHRRHPDHWGPGL